MFDLTAVAQLRQAEDYFEELEAQHIVLGRTVGDLLRLLIFHESSLSLQIDLSFVNARLRDQVASDCPVVEVSSVNGWI